MKSRITQNLEDILMLADDDFESLYSNEARRLTGSIYGTGVYLTGILALSNYCANDCLYCGLRSESSVNRFRLDRTQLEAGIDYLESLGVKRVLFISGEDPGLDLGILNGIIEYAAEKGMFITLGAGVFPGDTIRDFYSAGAREFCLKFETSNRELFRKVKPASDFDERIRCLEQAAAAGFSLATGSIIGLAGQTLEDVMTDFKYTLTFDPSWIPLVPYLPAPGTPMAETTPMGDVDLTLRIISLFRIMLGETNITAGQPAEGSALGFADPAGNAAALRAGANIFFVDATPAAVRKDFSIVGGRALAAHENLMKILSDNKKTLL